MDGVGSATGPMNIELIDLQPAVAELVQLVRDGLRQEPRQLPAWLLYDAEGSRLFSRFVSNRNTASPALKSPCLKSMPMTSPTLQGVRW